VSEIKGNHSPTFYHHKAIKKFCLNGIIHDESAIGRLKGEYTRLLISEMRLCGYVPRIDIDPDFTIDYNEKKKYFEFEISVHAVYAGKRKSEWILGIDGTKAIYIQKNKSNEYSQEQV
jgi:hypothetical protein